MSYTINEDGVQKGFIRKTYSEIKEELVSKAQTLFGNDVDLSSVSPLGMIVDLMSYTCDRQWQMGEELYYSLWLSTASGSSLDRVTGLGGISRKAAQHAVTTLKFTGTANTVIPSGTIVGYNSVQFKTDEAVTIESTGIATAAATSVSTGYDCNVASGSLTKMITSISGVTAVTNTTAATGGRPIETDAELRVRYGESFISSGSSLEGIRSAIANLDSVTKVTVIENADNEIVDEMPPRSIHVIVSGGKEADIAEAIFTKKPAGITTYGKNTVSYKDSYGNTHDICYSSPTEKYIFVRYTITLNETETLSSSDETLIRQNCVSYIGGEYTDNGSTVSCSGLDMGDSVIRWKLVSIQNAIDCASLIEVTPGTIEMTEIAADQDVITSSADGTLLAVITKGSGSLCTSDDSGGTWTEYTGTSIPQDSTGNKITFSKICSSADGSILALSNDSSTYVRKGTGGKWINVASAGGQWVDLAGSRAGTYQCAVTDGGYAYYSADSGATWTKSDSANRRPWISATSYTSNSKVEELIATGSDIYMVSSSGSSSKFSYPLSASSAISHIAYSADGKYISALLEDGSLYIFSANSNEWTLCDGDDNYAFKSVTWGEDHTIAGLLTDSTVVYSANSGQTWGKISVKYEETYPMISTSANGQVIAATAEDDNIYIYTHDSTEWTSVIADEKLEWNSLSLRYDGTVIAATAYDDQSIHFFTNVNGTWTDSVTKLETIPVSVEWSADGLYLNAITSDSQVYSIEYSTRNPVGKTPVVTKAFCSVSASKDGMFAAAAVTDGYIYTSDDYGQTWSEKSASQARSWTCTAVSGDKDTSTGMPKMIAAAVTDGVIYLSTDGGKTWSASDSGSKKWSALAVSDNGSVLAATAETGIYLSTDSGKSWDKSSSAEEHTWTRIFFPASGSESADGTTITAVAAEEGYILTSTDQGEEWNSTSFNDSDDSTFKIAVYSEIAAGDTTIPVDDDKIPRTKFKYITIETK